MLLIKCAEHTWGGQKNLWTGFYETRAWSNVGFAAARPTELFQREEDSWREQRQYLDAALDSLGPSSALAADIRGKIAALDHTADVNVPDPSIRTASVGERIVIRPETGLGEGFALRFDATGSLVELRACSQSTDCAVSTAGHSWANEQYPLARFVYKTRSVAEGIAFYNNYSFVHAEWGPKVFAKVGLNSSLANSSTSYASVQSLHANSSSVLATLRTPRFATESYGAPETLRLRVSLPSMSEGLRFVLTVINKTTTRLPEEAWLEFRPVLPRQPAKWKLALDKMGAWVDPMAILVNGSRTLHAVGDGGLKFTGEKGSSLQLASLDASLVSPGKENNNDMYAFPGAVPKPQEGVAISLWNNIWNCNYIYWYPFDAADTTFAFRFGLKLKLPDEPGEAGDRAICGPPQIGFMYSGHDCVPRVHHNTSDAAACCQHCLENPLCNFYSFARGRIPHGGENCWLKTRDSGRRASSNSISGSVGRVKPQPHPPPPPLPPDPSPPGPVSTTTAADWCRAPSMHWQ